MTPNDLFAAFETLAEAEDGVKRLRELVLQLAVRGKLVPQAADETSWTPFRTAGPRREPNRKSEPLASTTVSLPEIPESWRRLAVVDLATVVRGVTYAKADARDESAPGLVALLRAHNIQTRLELDRLVFVPRALVKGDQALRAGDLLVCIASGSANLVGKAALVRDPIDACFGAFTAVVRPRALEVARWLDLYFSSPDAKALLIDAGRGIGINNLKTSSLADIPVPVPPLAEQHRIVARVDELMALLDRLEAARLAREEVRRAARDAALAALREADDAHAVEAAWGRVAGAMGTLFRRAEDVGVLRQAVLQLAVWGKLVPQDPGDEPADSVLLSVAEERSVLVARGQLRRAASEPLAVPSPPFIVPHGWRWSSAAGVTLIITDGDHQPPPRSDDGFPFVVIGNVSSGTIDLSDTRLVPPSYFSSLDWTKKPKNRDLLYTVTGSFGLVIPVETDTPFCVQRHIGIIKSAQAMNWMYLAYVLRSAYAQAYATDVATGIAQKTVPLSGLRALPVPVPPLPEQHRIVAKVDALMALCDDLEGRLTMADDLQTKFASAAVHHLDA